MQTGGHDVNKDIATHSGWMMQFDCEWCHHWFRSWWRHQMETFSALLALCARNSLVTGEFPSQRPVTRSFDVLIDLSWVNNRDTGDLRRHWAHYDVIVMITAWRQPLSNAEPLSETLLTIVCLGTNASENSITLWIFFQDNLFGNTANLQPFSRPNEFRMRSKSQMNDYPLSCGSRVLPVCVIRCIDKRQQK